MADDQATWRRNLPEDFQGKHAEVWDGEIDVSVVYKSGVAVAVAFAAACGICWLLLVALMGLQEQPYESPIPEANLRRLPPSPLLQASPEAEMEVMKAEMRDQVAGYGWVDELDGRVHIPVDRAMELVLRDGITAPTGSIEPTVDEPRDLVLEPAADAAAAPIETPTGAAAAAEDGGTP